MIASAHIAAGLVVGMATAYATESKIGRITMGFTLGVLSHMVLDAIPHLDYGVLPMSRVPWIVLGECISMTVIGWWLLHRRVRPRWADALVPGLLGAVLPDAKFVARLVLPTRSADLVSSYGDRFHALFHAGPIANHMVGQATQLITTFLLLTVLTLFPRTR